MGSVAVMGSPAASSCASFSGTSRAVVRTSLKKEARLHSATETGADGQSARVLSRKVTVATESVASSVLPEVKVTVTSADSKALNLAVYVPVLASVTSTSA